jgi:hypothetical protein
MSVPGQRVGLTLRPPLPIYPQLRTYRCIALNDDMCHEETFARKPAGVGLPSIRWKVGLIFLSDYR